MSLYDDFKKENVQSSEASTDQEVYAILKEPFYKRKEFYILCSTILAIITVVSLLLYTPKFEMEDLSGKDEAYAKTFSDNYNLSLQVTSEFNDEYSRDLIYDQSIKAGETVKEGIVLEVKISKGPDYEKKIDLPDFREMTYDEALKWKDDNFVKGATIKQESSDTYENGVFIKEDISEDVRKNTKRSSEFTITYSKGAAVNSDVVRVEDFSGKTTAEVATWAYNNNLELNVTEIFDKYLTPGVIVEQGVKAGGEITKGSTFNVTVCVGEGVVVPNFYGLSKAKAASAASSSGVVTSESSVYSANTKTGALISQSISSGTRIKETQTVELVYSLGKVPIGNYQGSGYTDAVAAIDALNESGANIIINTVYVTRPEGEISGTVASNTSANLFVVPGSTITINVYK